MPLVLVTVLLAGCDQSPKPPPAAETPAAPAAAAPATPAAATTTPAPAAPSATGELAALAPLVGSWAADATACGTPIVIDTASFSGAENTCTISGWTDNGDGTYTAAMGCQAEGQTNNERIRMTPIFGPTGEGIRLEYLDRDGSKATVFRCAVPRAQ